MINLHKRKTWVRRTRSIQLTACTIEKEMKLIPFIKGNCFLIQHSYPKQYLDGTLFIACRLPIKCKDQMWNHYFQLLWNNSQWNCVLPCFSHASLCFAICTQIKKISGTKTYRITILFYSVLFLLSFLADKSSKTWYFVSCKILFSVLYATIDKIYQAEKEATLALQCEQRSIFWLHWKRKVSSSCRMYRFSPR